MHYRDANLTQRSGYPSRAARHSPLEVPLADEYSSDASSTDGGGGGGGDKSKKKRGRKYRGNEPWIVSVVKEASFFTKATYVWMLASLLVCYLGYRSIRGNHASVWLNCTARGCDLQLTPPYRGQSTKVSFERSQIVRADMVKVDAQGKVKRTEPFIPMKEYSSGQKRPGSSTIADLGPDEDGLYDSYVLVLREGGSGEVEGDGGASATDPDGRQTVETQSLAPLFKFAEPNEMGEYRVDMRMYNRGQTRRKTQTMAARINSYIRTRRHHLSVRENRSVSVWGVVSVVVGLFSFILSLLLGQLWEPEEEPKKRAPAGGAARRPLPGGGARRPAGGSRRPPAQTGYGSYGGYSPQPQGGRARVSASASRPKGGSAGYGSGYTPQGRR